MKLETLLKYGPVLWFLSILVVYMIPLLDLRGYHISVFDFLGLSSDLNGVLEQYEEYTTYLQSQIAPYRGFCIALICLPVAEAVAAGCLRGSMQLLAGSAGCVLNNIAGVLLWSKITALLGYINSSLVGLLLTEPLTLEKTPLIVWCILHGILIINFAGLWFLQHRTSKTREERLDTGTVIFDEIKEQVPQSAAKDVPKTAVMMEEQMEAERFYGVIICEKGIRSGEVIFLKKEEQISFGTGEDHDIFLVGTSEGRSCCRVSYDWIQGEYWVQPLDRATVFLESGQPLGKNRLYCIPREKLLVMENEKNQFRLG